MPAGVFKCETCRDFRRHTTVTTRRGAAGPKTRTRVCQECGTSSPLGLCCAACGDVRLITATTRQGAGGITVRQRKCHHCGRSIKTRETIESASA